MIFLYYRTVLGLQEIREVAVAVVVAQEDVPEVVRLTIEEDEEVFQEASHVLVLKQDHHHDREVVHHRQKKIIDNSII